MTESYLSGFSIGPSHLNIEMPQTFIDDMKIHVSKYGQDIETGTNDFLNPNIGAWRTNRFYGYEASLGSRGFYSVAIRQVLELPDAFLLAHPDRLAEFTKVRQKHGIYTELTWFSLGRGIAVGRVSLIDAEYPNGNGAMRTVDTCAHTIGRISLNASLLTPSVVRQQGRLLEVTDAPLRPSMVQIARQGLVNLKLRRN